MNTTSDEPALTSATFRNRRQVSDRIGHSDKCKTPGRPLDAPVH